MPARVKPSRAPRRSRADELCTASNTAAPGPVKPVMGEQKSQPCMQSVTVTKAGKPSKPAAKREAPEEPASADKRRRTKENTACTVTPAKPGKVHKTKQTTSVHQQQADDERQQRKHARKEQLETAFTKHVRQAHKQLSTISRELALVEAYEGDGWKGASKDKFKPIAELKRARHQIRRCKDVIRQCIKSCEDVPDLVPLPSAAFDEEGEIDAGDIFCCRCQKGDSHDGNDIVLCDGACNRAYHEQCCEPPFVASAIPEDCLWLCPSCDAKAEIVDAINDVLETDYEIEQPWQEILAPEAEAAANGTVSSGWLSTDWPSDDEEDSDYDLSEAQRSRRARPHNNTDEAQSPRIKRVAAQAQASHSTGQTLSDVSDGEYESCSSSGSEGSDAEIVEEEDLAADLAALGAQDGNEGGDGNIEGRRRRTRRDTERASAGGGGSSDDEIAARARAALDAEEAVDPLSLVVEGKRRRKAVDYAALAATMAKDELLDEADDGEWNPHQGAD